MKSKKQLPIVVDDDKIETFSCSKDEDLIFIVTRDEKGIPSGDLKEIMPLVNVSFPLVLRVANDIVVPNVTNFVSLGGII